MQGSHVMIDLDFLTSPQPVAKCYVFCFALFSCHRFDAAKYSTAQETCVTQWALAESIPIGCACMSPFKPMTS